MVFETIEQTGERQGAVAGVAHSLGIGVESLRHWVGQAEIDRGTKAGLTTEERRRIVEREKTNHHVATMCRLFGVAPSGF
jgi:transposase-like protein